MSVCAYHCFQQILFLKSLSYKEMVHNFGISEEVQTSQLSMEEIPCSPEDTSAVRNVKKCKGSSFILG
jgi:hypothetical protein